MAKAARLAKRSRGPEPARYLALRWGSNRYSFRPDGPTAEGGTDTSVKDGGDQIEYADENPEVHRLFESELQKTGAICHMKQLVQVCNGVGRQMPKFAANTLCKYCGNF